MRFAVCVIVTFSLIGKGDNTISSSAGCFCGSQSIVELTKPVDSAVICPEVTGVGPRSKRPNASVSVCDIFKLSADLKRTFTPETTAPFRSRTSPVSRCSVCALMQDAAKTISTNIGMTAENFFTAAVTCGDLCDYAFLSCSAITILRSSIFIISSHETPSSSVSLNPSISNSPRVP